MIKHAHEKITLMLNKYLQHSQFCIFWEAFQNTVKSQMDLMHANQHPFIVMKADQSVLRNLIEL